MQQIIWKIEYYQTASRDSPVYDFIEGLEQKAQTKVYRSLDLLREFGITLGLPHVKKLTGTNLWELRILGSDSIRILYVTIVNKSFLLLHGFTKKKTEIDRKEIKVAERRLLDYTVREDKK